MRERDDTGRPESLERPSRGGSRVGGVDRPPGDEQGHGHAEHATDAIAPGLRATARPGHVRTLPDPGVSCSSDVKQDRRPAWRA
ncbi:hypothetical protein GCM10009547_01190 [Sporichthya brevicatena]|uniref:Uncharacterized protein n=1 Tax=Sporichthya brevicatena TaxID=171442 RepID=A0ABN1G3G7_9ACTN